MVARGEWLPIICLIATACSSLAGEPDAQPARPTLSLEAIQQTIQKMGADEYGVRAMACERLLAHADERILAKLIIAQAATTDSEIRMQCGRLAQAVKNMVGDRLYSKDFWVLGPFPFPQNDDARCLYLPTPLESVPAIDLKAKVPQYTDVQNPGESLTWTRPSPGGHGAFDVMQHFKKNPEYANAFFLTFIRSEKPRRAILKVGSDDGIGVWLNGENVLFNNIHRGHAFDQETIQVDLEAGWNPVLFRVSQGYGLWALSFRVTDEEHMPWPAKDIDPTCGGGAMPKIPKPSIPPEPAQAGE